MTPDIDPEKNGELKAGATTTAVELGIASGHISDGRAADGVLQYASAEAVEVDDAMNKRILRKIDLHVLPCEFERNKMTREYPARYMIPCSDNS